MPTIKIISWNTQANSTSKRKLNCSSTFYQDVPRDCYELCNVYLVAKVEKKFVLLLQYKPDDIIGLLQQQMFSS